MDDYLTGSVASLETEWNQRLLPRLEQRREELQRARERLGELEAARVQREELIAGQESLANELAALRCSWSWRLTTPLRRLVELFGRPKR